MRVKVAVIKLMAGNLCEKEYNGTSNVFDHPKFLSLPPSAYDLRVVGPLLAHKVISLVHRVVENFERCHYKWFFIQITMWYGVLSFLPDWRANMRA